MPRPGSLAPGALAVHPKTKGPENFVHSKAVNSKRRERDGTGRGACSRLLTEHFPRCQCLRTKCAGQLLPRSSRFDRLEKVGTNVFVFFDFSSGTLPKKGV